MEDVMKSRVEESIKTIAEASKEPANKATADAFDAAFNSS